MSPATAPSPSRPRLAGAIARIAALAALATVMAVGATVVPLASPAPTQAATVQTPGQYGGGIFMAADPAGGYWTTNWLGAVTPHDGAPDDGSLTGVTLNKPIVGMAATPDGGGYWLVASDGGIFSFGDATFYGSTGSIVLNKPIVGMAATPDGGGYWLVASDGGVFTFGDAPFEGSLGGTGSSVNGVVVSSTTEAYSLVMSDGTVTPFGLSQSGSAAVSGGSAAVSGGPTPNGLPVGNLTSVLGVYGGPGDPSSVSDFAASLGAQPKFAMDFLDGTSWATIDSPSWYLSQWAGSGYTMIWGVPMLPESGASLATGATGAYNQYFTTLAQDFVAAGQGSSIIRLGWEFNGNWFPWAADGQASQFVAYWQQIVSAMRAVPGANFRFEWNPTRGDLGVGNLADYYPGDAYVDYVGLDVYDVEWDTYPGQPAEFSTMETEPYGLDWLASFSAQHDKPMTFPEWGLGWGTCSASGQAISAADTQVCGGDDGTFVSEMASWIATHDVYEATFWDYGSSSVDGGSNPITAAALQSSFG